MSEPTANSVSALNSGVAASPASHKVKALYRDLRLAVEYAPIESLKAYKRAMRTHSPAHIEQVEASIQAFGFVQPVPVDAHSEIGGGDGIFEASRKAGYRSIPVARLRMRCHLLFPFSDNLLSFGCTCGIARTG
ncbi:hypothetical protein [Microvirga sp. G4-2]|uniref:hypothetical protein n=1 Tax=Microvirga sp. G4-2 TaxID=3434467 RepID=UPI0040447066